MTLYKNGVSVDTKTLKNAEIGVTEEEGSSEGAPGSEGGEGGKPGSESDAPMPDGNEE